MLYHKVVEDVPEMTIDACLLGLCTLATSKVYQDRYQLVAVCTHGDLIVLPHCDTRLSCTMTQYPTHPNYSDTKLTSPCPVLVIPIAMLGSDKYKFSKSLI